MRFCGLTDSAEPGVNLSCFWVSVFLISNEDDNFFPGKVESLSVLKDSAVRQVEEEEVHRAKRSEGLAVSMVTCSSQHRRLEG